MTDHQLLQYCFIAFIVAIVILSGVLYQLIKLARENNKETKQLKYSADEYRKMPIDIPLLTFENLN